MDPAYRPSLMLSVPPFAGSDLVLSPSQWSSHVIGKVSSWIDLDSEDEILRCDSETTLKQEIAWASHLSLQACLLPVPKGKSCANYARCVNQILQGLSSMQLWLRIPLVKSDSETMDVNTDTLAISTRGWIPFLCKNGLRDYLQSPLQYQRAICKALQDRVPDDKASSITTVLMVVGAGHGPLVSASLQAAEETGRKLKVYAVEKNPNAVVTLHSLVKLEGWENIVTIITCDMRYWDAPEKADILKVASDGKY